MKFAICNELFQDWPWEKGLALARELGYTGWEVAPFTLGDSIAAISSEQRRQLAQQVSSADMHVVGLHWLLAQTEGFHLTTNDQEVLRRTAVYLGELAELCRDLEGSLMVLGSPLQRNFPSDMTHDEADANAMRSLEQVIPQLEKTQVTLALEPLGPGEGNFWNHASQTVRVIEQLACPWIKLHLDVKAMSTEGVPIPDVIRNHAEHMVHFHANDANLLGPGMGEIDFVPIFAALQEINYQDWVSVEVFDYSPGIEKIASESMQNMQTALAKCTA